MFRAQPLKIGYYLFLIHLFAQSGLCIENWRVDSNQTTLNGIPLKSSNIPANFSTFSTLENVTAPIITDTNISKLNLTTPTKNNDKSFTPSVSLGTMDHSRGYESRNPKTHPFNDVQHYEFGNAAVGEVTSSVGDDTGTVSVPNSPSVNEHIKYVYETDSGDAAHHPEIIHQNPHELHLPQYCEESYVAANAPFTPSHVYYTNQHHQQHHDEHHQPQFNFHHPQHHHHHQPHYETNPEVQHVIYDKPSKYEDIKPTLPHYHHHYEYIAPEHDEAVDKPEIVAPLHAYRHYYHDNQHDPKAHTTGVIVGKPETVLYLTSHRETSFTRTRKFPYKHYQPQDDTEIHLVKDEHAFPPPRRQISPWHKIIHIIGAFLPLGLLIAALKPPNVIKMNSNNTEPNIVLSKLRSIQLPIEHKELRNGNEELCESRMICESILRGAERNVKLIGNVLEKLATRSLKQDDAGKSEFNEFFEAVRKKDCNFIKC